MLTNQQLVDVIKANYNDDRMYGACLFIEEVHKRKTFGSGISQYRMTATGAMPSVITSLASYMAALSATGIRPEFPHFSEKLTSDRTASFLVTVTNVEVTFHQNSKSDLAFANIVDFGQDPEARYNVQYMIGYMNDADAALPLKIIWQRLVRVK